MSPSLKRRLLGLGALAAFVLGAIVARNQLGIEWSVESLREWVDGLGFWGPLVFVLIFSVRLALLVPSALLLMAGGAAFGTMGGIAWGTLGLFCSGIVAFVTTRWLGADRLRRYLPRPARPALEFGGTRGGAVFLALATAYPAGPLTTWHVGAALTAITLPAFALATAFGSVGRAALYGWLGDVLATGAWLQVGIGVGLLALAALPLLHPRARSWLYGRLTTPEAAEPEPEVD